MKRQYIKATFSTAIFAVLLLTTSCSEDFLNRYPIAEVSPENSFKTAKDLELYTNSFYEDLPSINDIIKGDNKSDNVLMNSVPVEQRSADRLVPATAGSGGWSWGDLRKINIFFDNYDRCEDAVAKRKYAGVAHFFRAYFYFDKLQRFGDVPWYDTEIKTDDTHLLYKARDSREYIVTKIIEDLESAVAMLGSEQKSDKITRWTALSMLSRVALYEGTYRKYHSSLNLDGSEELLTKAAAAAERVIKESGYKLYNTGSPSVDYRDLFASTLKSEEVILGRRYSLELDKTHSTNYYFLSKTQQDVSATKDLVDSYLNRNGVAFTNGANYTTKGFYEEMQNRDYRLAQTVRSYDYQRIGGGAVALPDFGAAMSGYQIAKFVSTTNQDGNDASYQDISIIRYGEVLLNFAEAKAELGTLTQSDLDISIKLLRQRGGVPTLVMDQANNSPDAVLASQYPNVTDANKGVILEVRRERRVELALEGFRYNDLMRWNVGELLTQVYRGVYFDSLGDHDLNNDGTPDIHLYKSGTTATTSATQKIEVGGGVFKLDGANGESGNLVAFTNTIVKGFDKDRDYLYPIPSGDILLNNNLEQNPNW